MAGRGRGMTLPAWMTNPEGAAASPAKGPDPEPEPESRGPVLQPPKRGANAMSMGRGGAPMGGAMGGAPLSSPMGGRGVGGPGGGGSFGGFGGPGGRGDPMGGRGGPPQMGGAGRGGPQQYGAPSAAPSLAPTPLWTEHKTPEGKMYWFNTKTQASSWEKPEALKSEVEKKLATCPWKKFTTEAGKAYYSHSETKESCWTVPAELKDLMDQLEREQGKPASSAPPQQQQQQRHQQQQFQQQQQHQQQQHQQQQLHQQQQQQQQLRQQQQRQQQQQHQQQQAQQHQQQQHQQQQHQQQFQQPKQESGIYGAASAQPTAASATPDEAPAAAEPRAPTKKEKKEKSRPQKRKYESKAAAKDAFWAMLVDREVSPDSAWNDAMKLVMDEPRYSALSTMKQKKSAFNEWAERTRRRVREERLKRDKIARDKFTEMLTEKLEARDLEFSDSWRSAVPIIENDERFQNLPETEREDLFEHFMYEEEKNQKEREVERAKKNIEEVKKVMLEDPDIDSSSQWRKVSQIYKDKGLKAFDDLGTDDRLQAFQDVIREHEAKEEEERRAKKEEELRLAREARTVFRDFLENIYASEKFTTTTRFSDFSKEIEKEEAYTTLLALPGATPREIFYDFVDDTSERLRSKRKRIEELIESHKEAVTVSMTFDEFKVLLNSLKAKSEEMEQGEENESDERGLTSVLKDLPEFELKSIFVVIQEKATKKEKHEQKKQKKAIDNFKDLLRSSRVKIVAEDTWEIALEKLEGHKSFFALEDEEMKKMLFNEYIEKLQGKEKRKREDDKDEEEENREEKRRKVEEE